MQNYIFDLVIPPMEIKNIYATYKTFGNENIFWRHLNICLVYLKYMSDIFWQIYI